MNFIVVIVIPSIIAAFIMADLSESMEPTQIIDRGWNTSYVPYRGETALTMIENLLKIK